MRSILLMSVAVLLVGCSDRDLDEMESGADLEQLRAELVEACEESTKAVLACENGDTDEVRCDNIPRLDIENPACLEMWIGVYECSSELTCEERERRNSRPVHGQPCRSWEQGVVIVCG